jgi:hypothetical protein
MIGMIITDVLLLPQLQHSPQLQQCAGCNE